MAQTESAQVLEAYREVIAASAKGQQDLLAPDQGSLYRDVMQESYKTILSMAPPLQLQAGFPIQKSELLACLEQGQQDWAPEQSSNEDTEEEPVKVQLSTWPDPGTWWNSYRSPVSVPSSDSSASDNESSSEKEEERNVKPEWVRVTKPRAPLLGKCEVKQEGCEQLGHPKSSMKMPFCWTNEKDRGLVKSRKRKPGTDPGKNHYVCPQCGNSFNRKSSLKRHVTTIHDGANPYEWPPRKKSSLEKPNRRARARSSHSGREPYECPECGESFTTNASFTKHRRTHTNETANECPECGKSYVEERYLIKHLMTAHSGAHLSKCLDCGKGFLREDDLSMHQTMIHGVESSHQSLDREKCYQEKFSHIKQSPSHATQEGSDIGEYVLKCPDCGMCFKAERCFLNHQRMHMEQKCQQLDKRDILKGRAPFARNQETHIEIKCNAESTKMEETLHTCTDCGKIFRDSRCFANHRSMHIKEEPSENADGQEAVEERAIDQQENHLKEKPYKCCTCGKTYATQYNLNRHQHVHTDNKPYKCTVCGKTFTYRYTLVHHEATHPEGKVCQHKCSYCGKGFTTKTSLSRHLQLHQMGRPYQCDICGKAFAYRYSLTHHQEIHVQGQAQKCLFCWKVFRTSNSLSRHKRIHMETRSYQCSVCGKAFGTKYSFCRHQDMHLNRSLSHSSSSGKGLVDGSALAKEQTSDTDENSNNWSGNSTLSEHSVKETPAERSEGAGGTPLVKCRNAHVEENSAKGLDSEGTCRENPVPLQDQATHAHKSVSNWSDNLICSGHQGVHMKEPPADFSEMVDSDILSKPQSTPLKENSIRGLDGGETLWDHSVDVKGQDSYGEEDASEGTYDLGYRKQQGACMEGSLPEPEMQGALTPTKHQSIGVNSIPRLDNEEPLKGSLTHSHLRGVRKGQKQHTCSNCGKSCRDKYSLTRHEKTHISERPYQCQKCGKRFRETKNLTKHQITHTDLRPFPCNKCGKHFKTKSTLDKHQKVHDKPFCCSYCGKRVSTSTILKNHLRTHTGEKPFKCTECGKDYRTKSSLNKHREGHLKKDSSEVPKEDQPNQIF
ncbi:zinc finger protein 85-like [Eublepharis macularius]|uniref:Zinc finger protein 85-like n=1 Tax=Eublepharis macularius TaxID=481883 RepID=A0AA97JAE6_EUBMA|nr:zinc finger protein 85-like [Eublepharis macularius]